MVSGDSSQSISSVQRKLTIAAVVGVTKMVKTPPVQCHHETLVTNSLQDAKAYSREGIRINAICPGFVDTPIIGEQIKSGSMAPAFEMTPIGRPAQVEEISDALLFLASPGSSYMYGAALVVDGGYTV